MGTSTMNTNQTQTTITNEEREGIGMIQVLLAFADQSESEETSLKNWRRMSKQGQETTRKMFYIVCGKPKPTEEPNSET